MRKFQIVCLFLLFLSFGTFDAHAGTVTCRVMDAQGKILGVYIHFTPDVSECDCSNSEVPEPIRSACAKSLKTF